MNKALRPCRQPGCINLVPYGYCEEHKRIISKEEIEKSKQCLRNLDKKKDPKEIKFYTSRPWIKTSKLYRLKHPLCERCEDRGIIKSSNMVHHKTELREIWKMKGNPLSWRFLQALCNSCHMEDLREKKGKKEKREEKKYKY